LINLTRRDEILFFATLVITKAFLGLYFVIMVLSEREIFDSFSSEYFDGYNFIFYYLNIFVKPKFGAQNQNLEQKIDIAKAK